MVKYSSVFFVAVFLSDVRCWVFNNMNYEELTKRLELGDSPDYEVNEEMLVMARINLIFPGTKWCGSGNVADGYDDLGPARETDKCCRAHDNCPDVIEAGETWHNLTNDAFYSRLSCECDETFRMCLHRANSSTSRTIGKTYFNVIGTKCFREDYPVIGCNRRGGWFNLKCLDYEYDTQGEKQYQWFDVPNY